MSGTRVRQGLAVVVVLGASLAVGQKPPEPQDSPVVFRSNARLVLVNVIAQDKSGKSIPDLSKEDFTLLDRGKPRTVGLFSVESQNRLVEPRPANFYSNQPQDGKRLTAVILLDSMNTQFGDQGRSASQLIELLQRNQPDARIAVYSVSRGLKVLHSFQDGPGLLRTHVEEFVPEEPPELNASQMQGRGRRGRDPSTAAPPTGTAGSRSEVEFFTRRRVDTTLQALEAIGQQLSAFSGRKMLIWMSSGFPMGIRRSPREFGNDVERAVKALNAADVAVYPIDARGLTLARNRQQNIGTMIEFAQQTGGKALFDSNDLAMGVQTAVEESLVSYTLGFYVDDEPASSEFRALQVRVSRPGVTLRHRQGYYTETPAQKKHASPDKVIRATLVDPLDATSVPLGVTMDPVSGSKSRMVVQTRIDMPSLLVTENEARWEGAVQIVFAQFDKNGRIVNVTGDTLQFRMHNETYVKTVKEGMLHRKELDLSPNTTALRVAVVDNNSSSVGSLTVRLKP